MEAARATVKYEELITLAQIPKMWQNTTFASSNPKINPVALKIAKRYAQRFSTKSLSLVFYSLENGTGKTHLAACIANYVLHELRRPVLFKKARGLLLEIRRSFADGANLTEADILDRVLSVDLLVLDDVGVDPPTEWLKATYWTLFDRRLEWELPVVVTTNKPIEPIVEEMSLEDRIGRGALSRLLGLCKGNVIEMTGPDLR